MIGNRKNHRSFRFRYLGNGRKKLRSECRPYATPVDRMSRSKPSEQYLWSYSRSRSWLSIIVNDASMKLTCQYNPKLNPQNQLSNSSYQVQHPANLTHAESAVESEIGQCLMKVIFWYFLLTVCCGSSKNNVIESYLKIVDKKNVHLCDAVLIFEKIAFTTCSCATRKDSFLPEFFKIKPLQHILESNSHTYVQRRDIVEYQLHPKCTSYVDMPACSQADATRPTREPPYQIVPDNISQIKPYGATSNYRFYWTIHDSIGLYRYKVHIYATESIATDLEPEHFIGQYQTVSGYIGIRCIFTQLRALLLTWSQNTRFEFLCLSGILLRKTEKKNKLGQNHWVGMGYYDTEIPHIHDDSRQRQ
ncbi:unnamed protein product [Nesidiocoris tenuis]|uniref:Uncharacterized protein n=1 Tax=Nesidiocoris tenuis TaxID=355587 RepID=A0A6H5GEP1_9HEMI|nr:unnamed protein product [Nesidiocoris tenuis]